MDLVFILGAGFNYDAADEAGEIGVLPFRELPAKYPLVSELHEVCFKDYDLSKNSSLEELFQSSIHEGDVKPLNDLCTYLMALDYYISPILIRGGSRENNVYTKFLKDFPLSPLLTFNYDSLPEILLLNERVWNPMDGYGIRVQVGNRTQESAVEKSLRPVLHLHGSLCVYAKDYYLERDSRTGVNMLKDDRPPEFIFNPGKLGRSFRPFESIPAGVAYVETCNRVIAPVPNKAEGLQNKFIEEIYRQSEKLLSSAKQIVIIGYSFNEHDRLSYEPLLAAAKGRNVLVISPDADFIISRLSSEYPDIVWSSQGKSFKSWVEDNYIGINRKVIEPKN